MCRICAVDLYVCPPQSLGEHGMNVGKLSEVIVALPLTLFLTSVSSRISGKKTS